MGPISRFPVTCRMEPRMAEDFLNGRSLTALLLQHPVEQVHALTRALHLGPDIGPINRLLRIVEGYLPVQQRVQKDSERPYFGRFGSVFLSAEDLGRSVIDGAVESVKELTRRSDDHCGSEIDEFHLQILVDDNILVFDVSMTYAAIIQKFYAIHDLLKDMSRFIL